MTAYEQGRAAHARGARTLTTSNPFERGTAERRQWLHGWTDAQREAWKR